MKKHLITQAIVLTGISLFTTGCVSPRQTATAGAVVGRVIAIPLGFAFSTLNETGLQTVDIVEENPRYDKELNSSQKKGEPWYGLEQ
ncbi:MAG: hypothetical protein OSA93_05435 [Akkermansiaceae bacterium]|nr:hypothetical protein [Akkermansiaceae bacterium]